MISYNESGLINFKDYYLYPVAFYSKTWEPFNMPYHCHPYYEIMYVEDGECTIKMYYNDNTDETKKIDVVLKKNMAIFINSSLYHRLSIISSVKMLHLEFERCNVNRTSGAIDLNNVINNTQMLKVFLSKNCNYFILKDASELISPIKRIHSELMENLVLKENNFFLLQSYIIELFIKMAKIFQDNSYESGIVYIRKALSYIRNNFTNNISADMIANELGISNGYLHKLVKNETGKTLIEIINNYRVEKAKYLIKTTSFPLIDIAIECGFNNRQNFHYIFKNITGMSPQEYRSGKETYNLYHFNNDYINFVDSDSYTGNQSEE
jgi:AraC-like DNA-binding protein